MIGGRHFGSSSRLIHAVARRLQGLAQTLRLNVNRPPLEVHVRHSQVAQLEIPELFRNHPDTALIEAGNVMVVDENPLVFSDLCPEITLANKRCHQLLDGGTVIGSRRRAFSVRNRRALAGLQRNHNQNARHRIWQ